MAFAKPASSLALALALSFAALTGSCSSADPVPDLRIVDEDGVALSDARVLIESDVGRRFVEGADVVLLREEREGAVDVLAVSPDHELTGLLAFTAGDRALLSEDAAGVATLPLRRPVVVDPVEVFLPVTGNTHVITEPIGYGHRTVDATRFTMLVERSDEVEALFVRPFGDSSVCPTRIPLEGVGTEDAIVVDSLEGAPAECETVAVTVEAPPGESFATRPEVRLIQSGRELTDGWVATFILLGGSGPAGGEGDAVMEVTLTVLASSIRRRDHPLFREPPRLVVNARLEGSPSRRASASVPWNGEASVRVATSLVAPPDREGRPAVEGLMRSNDGRSWGTSPGVAELVPPPAVPAFVTLGGVGFVLGAGAPSLDVSLLVDQVRALATDDVFRLELIQGPNDELTQIGHNLFQCAGADLRSPEPRCRFFELYPFAHLDPGQITAFFLLDDFPSP